MDHINIKCNYMVYKIQNWKWLKFKFFNHTHTHWTYSQCVKLWSCRDKIAVKYDCDNCNYNLGGTRILCSDILSTVKSQPSIMCTIHSQSHLKAIYTVQIYTGLYPVRHHLAHRQSIYHNCRIIKNIWH
jgi:hypothetical protein